MNLKDIDVLYTHGLEEAERKNREKAKKIFKRKILPKIIKAAKSGEEAIIFYVFSKKTEMLVKLYLLEQPDFQWNHRDKTYTLPPFVRGKFNIWGWKKVKPEPNSILKKSL